MSIIPDDGIKNSVVPVSMLPQITKNGEYFVRYRIVSDDGNETSTWSPHYVIPTTPISSNTITDKTILNPNGSDPAKYLIETFAKSHGKNFDVSWKINNNDEDLIEVPKPLVGISYDAYVRWGTKISTSIGPSVGKITITTELNPQLFVGEKIVLEYGSEIKNEYTVTDINVDGNAKTFKIAATSNPFSAGDFVWTAWEYITTTTSNSFSVPIPQTHWSEIVAKGYAEFMVHISTTTKDLDEYNYQTLLLYSDHISTQAIYDSTSLS